MKVMTRPRLMPMFAALLLCAAAAVFGGRAPAAPVQPDVVPSPSPTISPDFLLADIRNVFRSHRPPPPYEVYTLVRKQNTNYGYPDYANTYTKHYWYRSYDHAALYRKLPIEEGGDDGPLRFERPMFNQAEDPGPPTADIFEPAPLHTLPPNFVPTPEVSLPPVIVTVKAVAEFDYHVVKVEREGDELHLTVVPRRDPERNRLRQIWVDAKTLELRKVVATDKLFVEGGPVYPVLFTIYFSSLEGIPIITHIHGTVGGGYDGDGATVDYEYTNISFPKTLPEWYFDPHDYAQHVSEAPE
jgi:hypothetical protein